MSNSSGKRSFMRTLALVIVIAGTLDILDALIFFNVRFHVPPIGLLQSLASHLVGTTAFKGGMATALLGLAVHYGITAFWSAAFILTATRIRILSQQPAVCGMVYGVFIYAVMTYVVLPRIRLPSRPSQNHAVVLNGILALIFCMGLPIALINRRFAPSPSVS